MKLTPEQIAVIEIDMEPHPSQAQYDAISELFIRHMNNAPAKYAELSPSQRYYEFARAAFIAAIELEEKHLEGALRKELSDAQERFLQSEASTRKEGATQKLAELEADYVQVLRGLSVGNIERPGMQRALAILRGLK